jgi:pilus assembly protein CpaF
MSVENIIKSRQYDLIRIENEELRNATDRDIELKLNEKRQAVLRAVRDRLIESYNIDEINSVQKFNSIRDEAWNIIEDEAQKNNTNLYLDSYDKSEILELLIQTMFGYGILDSLIKDSSVTEIMVNGLDKIFIERNGKIEQAKDRRGDFLSFSHGDELLYVIEKIVAPINRKVDESNPIVDARLPNGFRVNVVLNPISLDGTSITIRKFPEKCFSMEDLVRFGTIPLYAALFLKELVEARYNIIISGGTGTGKTTFLNALSNFIDKDARVLTIEDVAELKLTKITNLVRLEARPPNIEGKGEIPIRNLVRSALRMRPDRIVVGEVRGGEALDMLQAMNTGHDGSLSTAHANSAVDMLSRLETMVLMSGVDLPLISIRKQIASAVEIIVHLSKVHDGSRKVVEIVEILGADNNGYTVHSLFEYRKKEGSDGIAGQLEYTEEPLIRTDKFLLAGKHPPDISEFVSVFYEI